MSDDQKDTQASGTDPKNDATDPSKTPTDGNKDATDQKKTSSNENKDATDPKQTPTDHKDEHIPQNIASVLQHIRDPKLIKDFSAALQSFSLGRHTSNGHSASETVQASNGEKEHAKMQYNLPPDVKDKKKKLLIGHGISFLIHVIMTYTLFLEWYNAIDPKITVVGAIILMVFVLCLLLLAFGGFVWMLHGKYKNEKAETEFFIS
nr:hypothetical protein K01A2.4 - Caenorhabditis elegans [Caenorhabditis elegans]